MAKVISVATSKGGQGKSTTCVLLATTLSGEPFNKNVCIVDADPQKSIYNQRAFDLKNNPEASVPFDVFGFRLFCPRRLFSWINTERDHLKIFINFKLDVPQGVRHVFQLNTA